LKFFFLVFRSFFIILDDNKQFPGKKFFFHFFEKISLVLSLDFWARDDLPMVISFLVPPISSSGHFYVIAGSFYYQKNMISGCAVIENFLDKFVGKFFGRVKKRGKNLSFSKRDLKLRDRLIHPLQKLSENLWGTIIKCLPQKFHLKILRKKPLFGTRIFGLFFI